MKKKQWKLGRDPLYRGDRKGGAMLPVPKADPSIVRHILYLEGHGRETPYLSSSESENTATRFAGRNGTVYTGQPKTWAAVNVKHISRKELLQLLRGKGKGRAEWSSAYDVQQANKYVEEAGEHLADFKDVDGETDLQKVVDVVFSFP